MLNITPTSIFPLKYPKGDSTIPDKGAMAVPVDLDWSKSTSYSVSLLVVQEQKFFGSLRCMWIDASANTHPITVAVNGTEQVFTVAAGSANYYAVVNLNIPVVSLTIGAGEATLTRVIFLNFVPEISMAGQVSIAGTVTVSGNVTVNNFPALQKVDLADVGGSAITIGQALMAKSIPVVIASDQSAHPVSQSGAWAVSVSNFPATQPVSGTVTVNQGTSPWVVSLASTTITGTVAVTQSGTWTTGRTWNLSSVSDSVAAAQSGAWTVTANQGTSPWVVSLASTTITGTVAVTQSGTWNVGITGTPSFNLSQVGGSAIALGQTTMAKSLPVVIASDQSNLPENLTQVGGSAISLGQKANASAIPVIDSCVATGIFVQGFAGPNTFNFGSAATKNLNTIFVTYFNYINANTLLVSVQDGSGNVLFSFSAGASASAITLVNYYLFEGISIPMSNGGASPKIVITGAGAGTSGNISIGLGFS